MPTEPPREEVPETLRRSVVELPELSRPILLDPEPLRILPTRERLTALFPRSVSPANVVTQLALRVRYRWIDAICYAAPSPRQRPTLPKPLLERATTSDHRKIRRPPGSL